MRKGRHLPGQWLRARADPAADQMCDCGEGREEACYFGEEVAVFGVPDERWGEAPVAAVTLVDGKEIAPDSLAEWANERVDAKYQRVADCVVLSDFPTNVAGKTLKREIRARYLADT